MDCPHHSSPLAPHLVGKREVFHCCKCSGHWVPGTQVQKLFGGRVKVKLSEFGEKSATSLCCPKDGAPLSALTIKGVTIDWCPDCSGLWLDRGELVKLRRKRGRLQNRSAKRRKRGSGKQSGTWNVWGAALDSALTSLLAELL